METTKMSNGLRGARNIGPTILKHLNEIGIYSLADLAKTTSVKAYLKICKQNPHKTFPVCYYLYSLEGIAWPTLGRLTKGLENGFTESGRKMKRNLRPI